MRKEENEKKNSRRIKQLDHILKDYNYLSIDNSYRKFVVNMHKSLIRGYKITDKMELAITNIVKSYTSHLKKNKDPKFLKSKEELMNKVNMVKDMLKRTSYTLTFKYKKMEFLDSVYDQANKRGTLSPKQKMVLNKMYKQFKKKVEKELKKP